MGRGLALRVPSPATQSLAYIPRFLARCRDWLLGLFLYHLSHIPPRLGGLDLSRMLIVVHPVHGLHHCLRPTIQGVQSCVLVLCTITQPWNGMGMHFWHGRKRLYC